MCVREDRTMQSAQDICGEAALLHNLRLQVLTVVLALLCSLDV